MLTQKQKLEMYNEAVTIQYETGSLYDFNESDKWPREEKAEFLLECESLVLSTVSDMRRTIGPVGISKEDIGYHVNRMVHWYIREEHAEEMVRQDMLSDHRQEEIDYFIAEYGSRAEAVATEVKALLHKRVDELVGVAAPEPVAVEALVYVFADFISTQDEDQWDDRYDDAAVLLEVRNVLDHHRDRIVAIASDIREKLINEAKQLLGKGAYKC